MKKQFSLLVFICIASTTLNAQTARPNSTYMKWLEQVHSITKKNSTALKTTGIHERIAALSAYDMGSTTLDFSDSGRFFYSNGRGSSFDYNEMQYNFEDDNSEVRHDSLFHYSDQGIGIVLEEAYKAYYNSNNSMSSFAYLGATIYGNPIVNTYKTDYTFDGTGKLIKGLEYDWNINQWDSTARNTLSYDSQNRLVQETYFDISMGVNDTKSDYTYDVSGNLTNSLFSSYSGSTWQPVARSTMAYDGNHHLITSKLEHYLNNWVNLSVDTFGYNGVDFFTYRKTRDWDTINNKWVPYDKEMRTLNVQNLTNKQSDYLWNKTSNLWEANNDTYWFYNSNNNPVKAESYSYIGSLPSTISDHKNFFYYEYYFDQSVNNIAKNNWLTIYPNPATTAVNIRWNEGLNNKTVYIALINSLGQTIYNHSQQINKSEINLSLSGIAAGSYFVSVKDADGNLLCRQSFIKQ